MYSLIYTASYLYSANKGTEVQRGKQVVEWAFALRADWLQMLLALPCGLLFCTFSSVSKIRWLWYSSDHNTFTHLLAKHKHVITKKGTPVYLVLEGIKCSTWFFRKLRFNLYRTFLKCNQQMQWMNVNSWI